MVYATESLHTLDGMDLADAASSTRPFAVADAIDGTAGNLGYSSDGMSDDTPHAADDSVPANTTQKAHDTSADTTATMRGASSA